MASLMKKAFPRPITPGSQQFTGIDPNRPAGTTRRTPRVAGRDRRTGRLGGVRSALSVR